MQRILTIEHYKLIKEAANDDPERQLLMVSKGDKPEVLDPNEWEITNIIDVIQDPVEIKKHEAVFNAIPGTYNQVSNPNSITNGSILYMTVMVAPRNKSAAYPIGEIATCKIKILNIWFGTNKLNNLRNQGKI
jgi:hypothetical protein